MRTSMIVLLILACFTTALSKDACARAREGDKTLSLGMNYLTWSKQSQRVCDGNGNDCVVYNDVTRWNLGGGISGGYLISDLLEVGISARAFLDSQTDDYVPAIDRANGKSSVWGLSGSGYVKLHLVSSETLVPFVAGGIGLGLQGATEEIVGTELKNDSGYGIFELFASGGVDYYIAEKYAISGFLNISRIGEAEDPNTDSGEDEMYSAGTWVIGFGLGISTYF